MDALDFIAQARWSVEFLATDADTPIGERHLGLMKRVGQTNVAGVGEGGGGRG